MPTQCPECGRFLSNPLIESLLEDDAPCPKCETVLSASMFYEFVSDPDEIEEPVDVDEPRLDDSPVESAIDAGDPAALDYAAGTAQAVPPTGSVRPPDLAPAADVHHADDDVLEGWDAGGEVVDLAGWRRDGVDVPTDAIVLASGGVAGAVLGAVTSRDRRGIGAALGLLAGVAGAAISRQVWRLDG